MAELDATGFPLRAAELCDAHAEERTNAAAEGAEVSLMRDELPAVPPARDNQVLDQVADLALEQRDADQDVDPAQ